MGGRCGTMSSLLICSLYTPFLGQEKHEVDTARAPAPHSTVDFQGFEPTQFTVFPATRPHSLHLPRTVLLFKESTSLLHRFTHKLPSWKSFPTCCALGLAPALDH